MLGNACLQRPRHLPSRSQTRIGQKVCDGAEVSLRMPLASGVQISRAPRRSVGRHSTHAATTQRRVRRGLASTPAIEGWWPKWAASRATGAVTRCEVPIAELEDEAGEQAVLDLVVWGGGELQDSILDITIRHPAASRYIEAGSATRDGACAEEAEEEKAEAYPPRGGVAVTAFAAETYGRLGLQAEQFIRMASAAAARNAQERGHPGASVGRWRASIDAAIMRGVIRGLRSAREGPGGFAAKRLRECSDASLARPGGPRKPPMCWLMPRPGPEGPGAPTVLPPRPGPGGRGAPAEE